MALARLVENPIFSHGTALFFWGISGRVPHILDLTVPQEANTQKLLKYGKQFVSLLFCFRVFFQPNNI
jgi:hypothetical protein